MLQKVDSRLRRIYRFALLRALTTSVLALTAFVSAQEPEPLPAAASVDPFPLPAELYGVDLRRQTREQALAKSHGCVQCHAGAKDMHNKPSVHLGLLRLSRRQS